MKVITEFDSSAGLKMYNKLLSDLSKYKQQINKQVEIKLTLFKLFF